MGSIASPGSTADPSATAVIRTADAPTGLIPALRSNGAAAVVPGDKPKPPARPATAVIPGDNPSPRRDPRPP